MTELFDQMESILTDLLRAGYRTASPGMIDSIRTLSENAEAAGLHTGAVLLRSISDLLNERQHTMQKNDLDLTDAISRLVRYIDLCRERLTEDAIRDRWTQGGSL